MLWGKLYSITDPGLVQSTLRAKGPSFEPFTLEFSEKIFNLDKHTMSVVSAPGMVTDFYKSFVPAMEARFVQAMNVNALNDVAKTLNAIKPGKANAFVAENAYIWIRNGITRATTKALFGVHDPITKDPSLIEQMW
jgi:hypothetical protein